VRKVILGTIVACLFAGTAVYAEPIADRKAAMKNVSLAMGSLVKMVKEQMDYDPNVALLAFAVINNATIGITSLFPEGTEMGIDTTAGPKIWEDMAGFTTAMAKFQADSAAAIAAKPADLDAFKAVFGPVAGNCAACHKVYRLAQP